MKKLIFIGLTIVAGLAVYHTVGASTNPPVTCANDPECSVVAVPSGGHPIEVWWSANLTPIQDPSGAGQYMTIMIDYEDRVDAGQPVMDHRCVDNGSELQQPNCWLLDNGIDLFITYPHAGITQGPFAPVSPSTSVFPVTTDWWTQRIYSSTSDVYDSVNGDQLPCPEQNWTFSECRALPDPQDTIGILPSTRAMCLVRQSGSCGWPDADGGDDALNPDFLFHVKFNVTNAASGSPALLWTTPVLSPGYEVSYPE